MATPSARWEATSRARHARARGRGGRGLAPRGGWVNNAGIDIPGSALDFEEADLRRVDVNLISTALGSAAAVRALMEQRRGGSIVYISLLQARAEFPSAYAYEASKGGIGSLTRQLAVEYGAAGIRVNSVEPGAIMTPRPSARWRRRPTARRSRAPTLSCTRSGAWLRPTRWRRSSRTC